MNARYSCDDPQQREEGLVAAVSAVLEGRLVVLPTDTVYGIGTDAFNPAAVTALLAARNRGREAPPTVLVGSVRAAAALTESLGAFGQDLIDEFWPGPLTLLFRASSTLMWDLGDTMGTVSIRMPLHPVTLELLGRTGPMAVSSASRHGNPFPETVDEAIEQMGDSAALYLDAGPCTGTVSTIVDLTGTVPRLLRAGALSADALRKVVPMIDLPDAAGGEPELSPADRRAAQAIAAANARTAEASTAEASTADLGPADLGPVAAPDGAEPQPEPGD